MTRGARLATALAVLAAVAALLVRAAPADRPAAVADVPRWLAAGTVDARLVSLAFVGAWACVAWLAVVLVTASAGALPRGTVRDVADRVLGIAVVGVATGALVAGPAAADGPFDRPSERSAGPATPGARAAPQVVVVTPGDSLWRIAERRLGPPATPALVAATWPRWYAANRPVIGPDPDLVLPGQRLVPPGGGPDDRGVP